MREEPSQPRSSEPESLSDVLSKLFALRGYGRVRGDQQLKETWEAAAGEAIASQTKVLSLRNGVLQIGVSNSALMSELASFHKVELLERLQEQNKRVSIRDLRFRLRRH